MVGMVRHSLVHQFAKVCRHELHHYGACFHVFVQQISCIMLGCLRLVQMAAPFLNSVYYQLGMFSLHGLVPTMMEQLGRGAFGEVHKTSAIMVSHRHMIHRNNGKSSSTAQSQACQEYLSNKYCRMASSCFWKLEWCCLDCVKFSKSSLLSKSASTPRT